MEANNKDSDNHPAKKKNRNGKGRGWSCESREKRTVEKGNYRRREKNGERSSIDNQPRLIIYAVLKENFIR